MSQSRKGKLVDKKRSTTSVQRGAIQTGHRDHMMQNQDLAHAIISPGQMTNPVGSSAVVTPVMAPTLDLSQNNMELQEHIDDLLKYQSNQTDIIVQPHKGKEHLVTSVINDSGNQLDTSLHRAVNQFEATKNMVVSQNNFNKGNFAGDSIYDPGVVSPNTQCKVEWIMVDGHEQTISQQNQQNQQQILFMKEQVSQVSLLASTMPLRSDAMRDTYIDMESISTKNYNKEDEKSTNFHEFMHNQQQMQGETPNNLIMIDQHSFSKEQPDSSSTRNVIHTEYNKQQNGNQKQAQFTRLKVTSENGVTFHSVDRQEVQSPDFTYPERQLPPTGGVNSTVLRQEVTSRGETPENVQEKAISSNGPQKLLPAASGGKESEVAIHAKNGTVFLKVQGESTIASKSQSFLKDQKLKMSAGTSGGKSAVSNLPATTSLNIEIKEAAAKTVKDQQSQQSRRGPADEEKDQPSSSNSPVLRGMNLQNEEEPAKSRASGFALSTGKANNAPPKTESATKATPGQLMQSGTQTATARVSATAAGGGQITVTMTKTPIPLSKQQDKGTGSGDSACDTDRPVSHLTFMIGQKKVAPKPKPSKLPQSSRNSKISLLGKQKLTRLTSQKKTQKKTDLVSKKTVYSTAKSSIASNDSEAERIDKIRGNLKLINQIMAIAPQQHRSWSTDVYLPLPNHNYVPTGKPSIAATLAKAQYYQIRQPSSKFYIKEPKMAKTVLRKSLALHGHPTQSQEDLQKKLSINTMSVGQMMQSDFFKMTQAQESLFRVSTINHNSQDGGLSIESENEQSPKGIVMLDQHGNLVQTNPPTSGRSQESEERVHLLPTTEVRGTNTTGSQVANTRANQSNTMKQRSSMITTITCSKAPTLPASKPVSAETLAEGDKSTSQHQPVTGSVVTRQVVAQSQPKFNQDKVQAQTADHRAPHLHNQHVFEVNTNTAAEPSMCASQTVSTTKRHLSQMMSFNQLAGTVELDSAERNAAVPGLADPPTTSAEELVKFVDKEANQTVKAQSSSNKQVISSAATIKWNKAGKDAAKAAEDPPETEKAILVLTNRAQGNEDEVERQRRGSQTQLEQVQSSSSTTPHIKLENPTFNSNTTNKVTVVDLKLQPQMTSSSAKRSKLDGNNLLFEGGTAAAKSKAQKQRLATMNERSKKQRDLCIEKLNTDLKRDLTKSMDYNCADKERNLISDMMVGLGPNNRTVKQSSSIDNKTVNEQLQQQRQQHMTIEPQLEEYHVFKLDEDFTINTADKQMEKPQVPTIGSGSLFASPANALMRHQQVLLLQHHQQNLSSDQKHYTMTAAGREEKQGDQYRSFSISQRRAVNTVKAGAGQHETTSNLQTVKHGENSWLDKKSTLKLDESPVKQLHSESKPGSSMKPTLAFPSQLHTISNPGSVTSKVPSQHEMTQHQLPTLTAIPSSRNYHDRPDLLQNTDKFHKRHKNFKNMKQVLAAAGPFGKPNEKKKPIEVHDFRTMSNQSKQFGMSIDVRVSREGTAPVSIPGEKETATGMNLQSGGQRNVHNELVNTHTLHDREVTAMTPDHGRQPTTAGSNTQNQPPFTAVSGSQPLLKSDAGEAVPRTAYQKSRRKKMFNQSKTLAKSNHAFNTIGAAEDDYTAASKPQMQAHESQFGPIQGCLDVRSSSLVSPQSIKPTAQQQQQQLFSAVKFPATGTLKAQSFVAPMVSKKDQRPKQFVIQFNDFTRQSKSIGQDMQVIGQNYSRQSDQNSMHQRLLSAPSPHMTQQSQQKQTEDVNKGTSTESFGFINNSDQIHLIRLPKTSQASQPAAKVGAHVSDYLATEINASKRKSQRILTTSAQQTTRINSLSGKKYLSSMTHERLQTANARKNIMLQRNQILQRQRKVSGGLEPPHTVQGKREILDSNFILGGEEPNVFQTQLTEINHPQHQNTNHVMMMTASSFHSGSGMAPASRAPTFGPMSKASSTGPKFPPQQMPTRTSLSSQHQERLHMATISMRNSTSNLGQNPARAGGLFSSKPTTAESGGVGHHRRMIKNPHQSQIAGGVLYSHTVHNQTHHPAAATSPGRNGFEGASAAGSAGAPVIDNRHNYKTTSILSKTQNEFTGIMEGVMTVKEVCSNNSDANGIIFPRGFGVNHVDQPMHRTLAPRPSGSQYASVINGLVGGMVPADYRENTLEEEADEIEEVKIC